MSSTIRDGGPDAEEAPVGEIRGAESVADRLQVRCRCERSDLATALGFTRPVRVMDAAAIQDRESITIQSSGCVKSIPVIASVTEVTTVNIEVP